MGSILSLHVYHDVGRAGGPSRPPFSQLTTSMKRVREEEERKEVQVERRRLLPELKDHALLHQRRLVKKIQVCSDLPGQLLWWPMGWGKTRGAILALELGFQIKGNILIITRAALTGNFHEELDKLKDWGFNKTRYTSVSYETFCSRPYEFTDYQAIVLDEVHHVRNAQSQRYLPIFQACQRAQKVIALSGTPFVNHGSDLGAILNLILATSEDRGKTTKIIKCGEWSGKGRQPYLPTTRKLWDIRYGETNRDNWKHLKLYTSTLISYVEEDKKSEEYVKHFPQTSYRTLEIPMDKEHYKSYQRKDDENRPDQCYTKKLSKKKALSVEDTNHDRLLGQLQTTMGLSQVNKSQFLGYVTKMRQASNYLSDDKCTKFRQVIGCVLKKVKNDPKYKAVIYSNFLKHGIDYFAIQLKRFKVPFDTVEGSTKDMSIPVKKFNSGNIRVLLITQSGVEGLNLTSKNGGEIDMFLMEPHWNETRLRQAECRVIRYDCGASKVNVWRLLAVAPNGVDQTIDTLLHKICHTKDEGLEGWKALAKKYSIETTDVPDLKQRLSCVA